jgi:C1A family cysteine protease
MPPVYDQLEIGSCTANCIAGAIQFDRLKLKEAPDFVPSRLFIYYNERAVERTIPIDAGAMIRDGIKSVASLGACPETVWPYIATAADPTTNLFPVGSPPVTKPPAQAYTDAKQHVAISYYRVQQTLNQLKGCLAAGYPFVFGFTVFSNIYNSTGNPVVTLTMPSSNDQFLGGHAVMAVGYDDSSYTFIIRNSWGSTVQDHGYFYMPYAYLTENNLSSDFWTIRKMIG